MSTIRPYYNNYLNFLFYLTLSIIILILSITVRTGKWGIRTPYSWNDRLRLHPGVWRPCRHKISTKLKHTGCGSYANHEGVSNFPVWRQTIVADQHLQSTDRCVQYTKGSTINVVLLIIHSCGLLVLSDSDLTVLCHRRKFDRLSFLYEWICVFTSLNTLCNDLRGNMMRWE